MNKEEADRLVKEGDKELKRYRFFSDPQENALEYFRKAANIYKYLKDWNASAEAYVKCANACKYDIEKMIYYENAMECYTKLSSDLNQKDMRVVYYDNLIIDYYLQEGEFKRASRIVVNLAMYYEKLQETVLAIVNYEKAINLNDDVYFTNKMRNKLVDLYLLLNNYEKCIENLNELIGQSSTFKYHRMEYILTLLLCYCCLGDTVVVKRVLASFPDFTSTDLMQDIIKCIEDNDKNTFNYLFSSLKFTDNQKYLIGVILKSFKDGEDDLC